MNVEAKPSNIEDYIGKANGGSGTPVTVAFGDGIGPEIMKASLKVLIAGGANISIEPIEIGEQLYRSGDTAGVSADSWDNLRSTKVFYKAPITTPQGGSGHCSARTVTSRIVGLERIDERRDTGANRVDAGQGKLLRGLGKKTLGLGGWQLAGVDAGPDETNLGVGQASGLQVEIDAVL